MDGASRDVPRDPVDLSVRKAVVADTQTRLALTDICAKLRDAKPSDGPLVDMLAVGSVAAEPQPQRPRTSRAPAMVGATLYTFTTSY